MTPQAPQAWIAEVTRRIAISEGISLTMYHDTMGIPTIAFGFNLQRPDASNILLSCGIADPNGVICGVTPITQMQAQALLEHDLPRFIDAARSSLAPGVFDKLSDARRFVIVDLTYNMGPGAGGWGGFTTTHVLLEQAVAQADQARAHALYGEVADHLAASAWASQVGDRAKRDIAMMRSSMWVEATGDGTV